MFQKTPPNQKGFFSHFCQPFYFIFLLAFYFNLCLSDPMLQHPQYPFRLKTPEIWDEKEQSWFFSVRTAIKVFCPWLKVQNQTLYNIQIMKYKGITQNWTFKYRPMLPHNHVYGSHAYMSSSSTHWISWTMLSEDLWPLFIHHNYTDLPFIILCKGSKQSIVQQQKRWQSTRLQFWLLRR